MYLWRSWCTLYLLACQARVTKAKSGFCCACVTFFKRWLTSLCDDSAWVLWALFCFIFSKTKVSHFKATPYTSYRVIVQVDKFWCLRTSKLLEPIWSCSNPKCQRSSDLPSFSYETEPIWRVWILTPGKFRSAPLHPHTELNHIHTHTHTHSLWGLWLSPHFKNCVGYFLVSTTIRNQSFDDLGQSKQHKEKETVHT